uniref:Peptidase S54 rhomboid domain-containing protein n=1 Tax=Polytomella parva TaxID=51329 RepID=A0A7S0YIM4_9CHLO|mmetsp:Transcript_28653/g.52678  ORF Transcript_28653/g.52678 Transcript_28653/m.52678 type:complete len:345 (+) Transcript_28653:159-1193(+)
MDRRRRERDNTIFYILVIRLISQVMEMENKPPITLSVVILNFLIFYRSSIFPGAFESMAILDKFCVKSYHVIQMGQWYRLLSGAFLHSDEYHIFYNMSSFLWKGANLEIIYGPLRFTALVVESAVLSHAIEVLGIWTKAAMTSALMSSPSQFLSSSFKQEPPPSFIASALSYILFGSSHPPSHLTSSSDGGFGLIGRCCFALSSWLPSSCRFLLLKVLQYPLFFIPGLDSLGQCGIGFSAAVFFLKMVLHLKSYDAYGSWIGRVPFRLDELLGFQIPVPRHVPWLELLLASVLSPKGSFWAHLSGVIAGYVHVGLIEPMVARLWQYAQRRVQFHARTSGRRAYR